MKPSISIPLICITVLSHIQTKEQNIASATADTEFSVTPTRTTDCIPRTSNCYDVNTSGGCDDKKCESAVCACDSYCCDIRWDLSCSGYPDNYFSRGCSAKVLCCQQPMEPYTPTCKTTIPSTSNCLDPHDPDGGCDDEICEALVCECDPYCCQGGGWDKSCVGYPDNYFNKGCSAKAFCCTESDLPFLEIGATSIPALAGPTSRPTNNPTTILSPTSFVPSPTSQRSPMPMTPPVKIFISVSPPSPSNEYCDCYRKRIPIVTT